jgi:hypothetical protein
MNHVSPNHPFSPMSSCSPADFLLPYRADLLVSKGWLGCYEVLLGVENEQGPSGECLESVL